MEEIRELSKKKKREIKLIMDKLFIDRVEESFCIAQFEDKQVVYRTLVSVGKEAFLRGIHAMAKERKELSKVHGKIAYLTEGGMSFIEDILEAYDLRSEGELESHERV